MAAMRREKPAALMFPRCRSVASSAVRPFHDGGRLGSVTVTLRSRMRRALMNPYMLTRMAAPNRTAPIQGRAAVARPGANSRTDRAAIQHRQAAQKRKLKIPSHEAENL